VTLEEVDQQWQRRSPDEYFGAYLGLPPVFVTHHPDPLAAWEQPNPVLGFLALRSPIHAPGWYHPFWWEYWTPAW
jgi:hypothetical protein